MDTPTIPGAAGLLLDILGVALLFIYTSTRTIEAELSYKIVRELTDEGGEGLQPYSFQEHLKRLRRLEHIDPDIDTTPAGAYRLEWLQAFIGQDRTARREIRCLERLIDDLLDEAETTLRDEAGIGPIAAATLLCEVGAPRRFDRESKFARWSGTDAVALSSGEGAGNPVKHRLDFRDNRRINSVLYIASVTQQRSQPEAAAYLARKTAEGKTRREARRAHKRHLANRIIRPMWRDETTRQQPHALAA